MDSIFNAMDARQPWTAVVWWAQGEFGFWEVPEIIPAMCWFSIRTSIETPGMKAMVDAIGHLHLSESLYVDHPQ